MREITLKVEDDTTRQEINLLCDLKALNKVLEILEISKPMNL